MDRKEGSRQASFTNDQGNAFHQSSDDLTFFIGHDHPVYSIDTTISTGKEVSKINRGARLPFSVNRHF